MDEIDDDARGAGDRATPRVRPARRVAGPPPVVPGFRVGRLLGLGAHGQVWEAVDLASGVPRALKVGPAPGAGEAGHALAREAALLARLRHEHLVAVHAVLDLPDGRRGLVLDLAAGSLAAVLDRHGPLSAGQVVTLLVPLAQALAAVHARGLVHGDLAPANVLLAEDGRPLLADLGVSSVLGDRADAAADPRGHAGFVAPEVRAGAPPSAASDVWALGALGRAVLADGPAGRPLRDVLARLAGADPHGRPSAREAARLVWQAAAARPLPRVDGSPPAPDPGEAVTRRLPVRPAASAPEAPAGRRRVRLPRPRRAGSGPARRLLGGTAGAGLVAAVAVAVAAFGGAGTPGADPPTARPPAAADVVAGAGRGGDGAAALPADRALPVLGVRRARALEGADPARAQAVWAPGSPLERADAALLDTLRRGSVRLTGVAYAWADVRVVRSDGASAVVAATVTTTEHRRVGPAGTVAVVPAGPPERVEVTLVRDGTDPGWLLEEVRPAA